MVIQLKHNMNNLKLSWLSNKIATIKGKTLIKYASFIGSSMIICSGLLCLIKPTFVKALSGTVSTILSASSITGFVYEGRSTIYYALSETISRLKRA